MGATSKKIFKDLRLNKEIENIITKTSKDLTKAAKDV